MIKLYKKNKIITLKKYSVLKYEEKVFVDYVLKNSIKSNTILRIGKKKIKPKQIDFWKLSWNDIILLRHYLSNKNMQAIHKLIYGITEKQFIKLDVFNASACYKWVVEQIKNINEIENNEVGDEPSSEDKAAGVERLQEFDYSVTLYGFRGTDISKDKELLQTQYAKIFKEICMRNVINDINKQKEKNARRKNKRNRR